VHRGPRDITAPQAKEAIGAGHRCGYSLGTDVSGVFISTPVEISIAGRVWRWRPKAISAIWFLGWHTGRSAETEDFRRWSAKLAARVAANGAPRRARSRAPWASLFGEHPVGLFADRTRIR